MQAISLWQPYATLVAIGAKPFETRHWAPNPSRIGRRTAIHAAQRRPTRDEIAFSDPRIERALSGPGWQNRMCYGAVVATAVLSCAWQVVGHDDGGRLTLRSPGGQIRTAEDDGFGDYDLGRWCWEFTDAVPVPATPLRGRQSWFSWQGAAA